jgi:hypothetical protein
LALSAPVVCEPDTALLPLHAPDAIQEVALVLVQVIVELSPLVTELGAAPRLTVGEGALTNTVADCAAVPPGPVQVRVNVDVSESEPVPCDPCVALPPDQAPEAEHAVALLEDQVNVAVPPLEMEVGPTLSCTVGAGDLTDTVVD